MSVGNIKVSGDKEADCRVVKIYNNRIICFLVHTNNLETASVDVETSYQNSLNKDNIRTVAVPDKYNRYYLLNNQLSNQKINL